MAQRASTVPDGVTPFVVLADARTGSTLLMECLAAQWVTIRADGEIFSRNMRRGRPARVVVADTYFVDTGHALIGSKILAGQVSDDDLRALLNVPGIRVVILQRRNIIRQLVSLRIASQIEIWRQSVGDEGVDLTERVVEVQPSEVMEYRTVCDQEQDRYAAFTDGLPVCHVTYEDMMADLDGEVRRMAEFLGAGEKSRSVPPRLQRQNPESLRELINNFDELRAALSAAAEHELVAFLDEK